MKKCPGQEVLTELAFALANNEKLSSLLKSAAEHIAQCDACKRCVDEHIDFIGAAKQLLAASETEPGSDCLDNNILAAYVDGTLSVVMREKTEAHMAQCQYCVRQLAGLAVTMERVESDCEDGAASTPSPVQYVVALIRTGLKLIAHPSDGFTPLPLAPVQVLGPDATTLQGNCGWVQTLGPYRFSTLIASEHTESVTLTISIEGECADRKSVV